ncbi:MAG: type II toxin-antitoxin system HicB family antitoxin [Candidatus Chisholmbacteria bacterium]|nr:type II toxin-antitoxin system HicB family antitoxin [Candidatus Chisholmbacteria bacterium]
MTTKFYTFTALFEKEPGTKETYNVSVPALPGCLTFGESKKEAEFMIQDALMGYLETVLENGLPIAPNQQVKAKRKSSYTKDIVVGIKQEVMVGLPAHETARFARA